MEINQFFEFSSDFVSTTFQAYPIGLKHKDDKDVLGDALRLVIGDYKSISFPVTFKQEYGKNLHDLLNTGYAALYLISDNMKFAFEENMLTGWKTFPIRLLDKRENEILGYHGLSVTGRCGPIDITKSEIIEKRVVPNGPLCKYYKGFHVGLDKWDGGDFFLPKHYYGTIISAKAAEIIKKNKFSNIHLTNLADIEISSGTADLIRSKQ